MKKSSVVVVSLLVVISLMTVLNRRKRDQLQNDEVAKLSVAPPTLQMERSTQTNIVTRMKDCPSIDPAQKVEIQKSLEEIVVAFSNRQAKVMCECFERVSVAIRDGHQGDLGGLAYTAFMRELDVNELALGRRVLSEFKGVEDFRRYAESVLELARILGDLELMAARSTLSTLENADFRPLYFFEKYQEKYQREKRHDFEVCVRNYIAICHDRIEAENGYVHTAMRKHCQSNMELVEAGRVSLNDMHWAARRYVMGALLKLTNYKPKWLDTEFPIPAGYKPGCRPDASKNSHFR